MDVKISLTIARDTDNSYPSSTLDLEIDGDVVRLSISGELRVITVDRAEIAKALRILELAASERGQRDVEAPDL
jgi:hypothetical protein